MQPSQAAADAAGPAPDFTVPATVRVPVLAAGAAAAATPRQTAFRQTVAEIERLRELLREARRAQAEARRRYWQQVGPVASAVVAARRALFPVLEEALLLGYFNRMENSQLTDMIVGNARTLEERFGEDETVILGKYGPAHPPPSAAAASPDTAAPPEPTFAPDPSLPPHEQAAAAARARRKTKAQRAADTAAEAARADQQQLDANTKTLYRQLARAHHPDLERDPAQQAAKTTQMQRITAAYEADDLYALLEILAESGPTDAEADDVLARYTRALLQQQASLQQEITAINPNSFGAQNASAKKQEKALRQIKRDLRAEADYVQQMGQLMREPAGLREVLRQLLAEGLTTV